MPKSPSSSSNRRRRLYEFVNSHGRSMPTPCGRCKADNLPCKVDIRSGNCGECIRRGRKCDLVVSRREWDRLSAERKRLEEQLKQAKRAVSEAISHEARLERQLEALEENSSRLVSRELASIEELERIETAAGSSLPDDPSDLSVLRLSPGFWTQVDEHFPGLSEIVGEGVGSS